MVFNNNLLLGASGQGTGQANFDPTLIGNSIWLDGSADFLNRQNGSDFSNRKEVTLSFWVQRNEFGDGTINTRQAIFAGLEGSQGFIIHFKGTDTLELHLNGTANLVTNAVFRDISWYHILVSIDTSQAVSSDRSKVYINGEQITSFSSAAYPSQNSNIPGISGQMTSTENMRIGNYNNGVSNFYFHKGYVTQACMIESKSIQQGDFTVSDFLDTFTFGTNGSQIIPKADADIAALATSAGGNSFCLNFSSASVALSSGITPTSNAGTFSGSLSNLTDGNFTTEWRSTVDPATNVSNDHVAFDLGSAKNVKAVKVTGRSSITGNFKVQFSDNGSDFTDTGTTFSNVSITSTANSGILDLTSDNPGSHRYWKLINISNSSGTSAWGFKQIILDSAVGNLGTDASGNGNDFTPTSIDSNNQSSNTPSNSYPILNVLDPTTATASSGNLNFAGPSADNKAALRTTIGIPDNSGKFYFEYEMTGGSNDALMFGIAGDGSVNDGYDDFVSDITPSIAVYTENGSNKLYVDGSVTTSSLFGSAPSSGDIIGIAYDSATRKVWFALNNTYAGSGNPAAGSGETATLSSSGTAFPTVSARGSSDTLTLRFDSSDFTHSAPTGYNELNTENLTAPTYQGIDYFDATLYEGNGFNQRVGDFVPFTDAYTIDKSAMFDDGDRRYLAKTFDSDDPTATSDPGGSNSAKATISFWIKYCRSVGSGDQYIFSTANTAQTQRFMIYRNEQSAEDFFFINMNPGPKMFKAPVQSALLSEQEWSNVVINIDLDNGTGADKVKMFVNGVQITSVDTTYQSASNSNYFLFSNQDHFIGNLAPTSSGYTNSCLDSYLAEMHVIDGHVKAPTDFGQVDTATNRWVAKDYKTNVNTYGNRGFYMAFDNASGTSDGVGTDSSGNNFHFTESFVSGGSAWVISDTVIDTPSQNFDVLGGAQVGGTISEGNTKAALGTGGNQIRSNFNLSSGKWYVESDIQATNNSASIGLVPSRSATFSNGPGRDANGGISYETDGDVFSDNVQNATAEASFAAGDVIQMAIDMDAKKVYFGKNNTFGGDPAAGTGGHFLPASILSDGAALITLGNYAASQSSIQQINYGQFLNFDGGSTTNGFKYTPPTGFKAVNQDNLDDTASKITAWSWIKNRDAADNHMLFDRVRGVGKDLQLFSNSTVAQATDANTLQRFLQRGVQVGNDAKVNTANESFVLWQWLVGDSATTGTVIPADNPPSIASTVITADAGHFSVGTFTGAGGASTIGHGLSAAPEFFLVKRIGTSGTGWFIYSKDTTDPNNKFLRLQGANAEDSASGAWSPGATTMGLNESSLNGINTSGVDHLFIAFRSVPGVCKVGSYIGNGDGSSSSFDGPYISTGFKPKWLMVKWMQGGSLSGEGWLIKDTSRQVINPNDDADIYASQSTGENAGATHGADILADGFKLRGGGGANNKSGAKYLYLAMAEIGGNGTLPPVYGR